VENLWMMGAIPVEIPTANFFLAKDHVKIARDGRVDAAFAIPFA
jgi:hypothetical protein